MVVRSNPPQDPDELRLTSLTQRLILNRDRGILDQLMQKITHVLHGRRVKNIARPGDLNFAEALAQIDEELIVNAVEALLDDLRDLSVDEALIDRLAADIDGVVANLPDAAEALRGARDGA